MKGGFGLEADHGAPARGGVCPGLAAVTAVLPAVGEIEAFVGLDRHLCLLAGIHRLGQRLHGDLQRGIVQLAQIDRLDKHILRQLLLARIEERVV